MNKNLTIPEPLVRAGSLAWRGGALATAPRAVPQETPVVLTYDRVSFAVMMATPQNLEDFAIGFSISEHLVTHPSEITALEIVALESGVECRMSLSPAQRDALTARRRKIAGPMGCGLCGMESLTETLRPIAPITASTSLHATTLADGFARLSRLQTLNQQTRAVHAAAFFHPAAELLVREDVGRHNALDKLIGAASRQNLAPHQGAVLLTSRVSIELIQKTAAFGAPILAAISVPTARAIEAAQAANITLIAVARDDGFEIFTHPERIIFKEPQAHVA